MKRKIAALLGVVMIFGTLCLSGCSFNGGDSESSDSEEIKSSAPSSDESTDEEPEESSEATYDSNLVNITKDNWKNYFEPDIIEITNTEFDEYGNIKSAVSNYYLKLKSEYADKTDEFNYDAKLDVVITFDLQKSYIFPYGDSYYVGDLVEDLGEREKVADYIYYFTTDENERLLQLTYEDNHGVEYDSDGNSKAVYTHYSNVQIKSIEGTIALFD